MVKVRLCGTRATQWFIDGKSYPGEYVIDLPQSSLDSLLDKEKKKGLRLISEILEKESVPVEPTKNLPKSTNLVEDAKKQQFEALKEEGLSDAEARGTIYPDLPFEDMDKNELESYALDNFNVDLDKRKPLKKLIAQVKELGATK